MVVNPLLSDAFAGQRASSSVADPAGSEHLAPGRLLAGASAAPQWMQPLLDRATTKPIATHMINRLQQPSAPVGVEVSTRRQSAVLILLAEGSADGEPDLLLTQRSATLRHHGGQPAFPGGSVDPGEGAVEAALREGWEETGVDPASINPVLLLPPLYLWVSNFLVTPVVAHWVNPGPVAPVDPAETAAVARVPLRELAAPENRLSLRHPLGHAGPAFDVAGMRVWGFTGMVIDLLLELGGWQQPWDEERFEPMPISRRIPGGTETSYVNRSDT